MGTEILLKLALKLKIMESEPWWDVNPSSSIHLSVVVHFSLGASSIDHVITKVYVWLCVVASHFGVKCTVLQLYQNTCVTGAEDNGQ